MKTKYEEIRGLLENSLLDQASVELARIRKAGNTLSFKLLTVRLSLKLGTWNGENLGNLESLAAESDYWRGEIDFVKGLQFIFIQKFLNASEAFESGSQKFESGNEFDRAVISRFNSIICLGNHHNSLGETIDLLPRLRDLEMFARKSGAILHLGLLLRQKSYIHFERGDFFQAVLSVSEAITRLENRSVSDLQLAILHACNCALSIESVKEAMEFFVRIPNLVDERVQFPRDFMNWRLGGKMITPSDYVNVPPYWLDQYLNHQSKKFEKILPKVVGGPSLNEIVLPKGIRTRSLEGKVLTYLAKGRCSKESLIGFLWPDMSETHVLDNRLHRLLSRINKKSRNAISFDGSYYVLNKAFSVA